MASFEDTFDQKLQNFVSCPICLQMFEDPVSLPCIHTFCRKCIADHGAACQNTGNGTKFSCPACRREFLVPAGGFVELEQNSAMIKFVDLKKSEKPEDVETSDSKKLKLSCYCTIHSKEPLDIYCWECKQVFCTVCVVDNHPHHNLEDVRTASEDHRRAIGREVGSMLEFCQQSSLERKFTEQMEHLTIKVNEVEKQINEKGDALKAKIDAEKENLLRELGQIKDSGLRRLEEEKQELQNQYKLQTDLVAQCSETTESDCPGEICLLGSDVHLQAENLLEWPCNKNFPVVDIVYEDNDFMGMLTETHNQVAMLDKGVLLVGLFGDDRQSRDVVKVNLAQPSEGVLLEELPTPIWPEAAAIQYQNTVLVLGVGDQYNEIMRFDVNGTWSQCGSLIQSRRRHSAAFVYDKVYVMGGYVARDVVLDCVEAYDPQIEQSVVSGKLRVATESATAVADRHTIYVFGGVNSGSNYIDSVQAYNTNTDTCSLLLTPLPRPCGLLQSVLWENSIFLFNFSFCFIFNLSRGTWIQKHALKTDLSHFALVSENQQVFIFGGGIAKKKDGKMVWTYTDAIKSLHLPDVIDDKQVGWITCGKLPRPACISAYAKMSFLSDKLH